MSKPRDLSKLFTSNTNVTTDQELISTVNSASAYALSEANDYTDNELSSIDLTSTINTASAAAFASASAYTDSAIASFEALPSQTGNAGKYLSTSGSVTSWEALDLNAAINTASAAAVSTASVNTTSAINALSTTDIEEGSNLYFTNQRAINAGSATYIPQTSQQSIINSASAAAVTYLVDSAPSTLDTLNELAAALGDDPNYATTITNALAAKLDSSTASTIYLTQSNASATYATKAEAQNSIDRWTKIYSASATTISGVDDSENSLSYTPNFENLYINGILQDPTNYTAISGSTIILNEAVLTNDVVEVISINPFNVANTYTTSQIDEKISNYTRWVKTLSGSATVISGVDDNSLTLNYTPGNEQVYVNGILIKETTDYVATSASVITLTEAALSGDTIEVLNYTTINLANVYTQTQSDNKFLTQVSASSTYLTQSSASSTYLTQTSASSTYLTQVSASSTYAPLSAIAIFNETQNQGTEGGTNTNGTFTKRTLNTTVVNTITGCSIASSVITLPAGTYHVTASAPAFAVNGHRIRLRNTSDGATTVDGATGYTGSTGFNNDRAVLEGYFTITSAKNFELQHMTATLKTGNGLGAAQSQGSEIYSIITIRKI